MVFSIPDSWEVFSICIEICLPWLRPQEFFQHCVYSFYVLGGCLGLNFSFFTCLMVAHKCDGTPGMIWAFFLFREPRHGAYHQVEELKVSFGSAKR